MFCNCGTGINVCCGFRSDTMICRTDHSIKKTKLQHGLSIIPRYSTKYIRAGMMVTVFYKFEVLVDTRQ